MTAQDWITQGQREIETIQERIVKVTELSAVYKKLCLHFPTGNPQFPYAQFYTKEVNEKVSDCGFSINQRAFLVHPYFMDMSGRRIFSNPHSFQYGDGFPDFIAIPNWEKIMLGAQISSVVIAKVKAAIHEQKNGRDVPSSMAGWF